MFSNKFKDTFIDYSVILCYKFVRGKNVWSTSIIRPFQNNSVIFTTNLFKSKICYTNEINEITKRTIFSIFFFINSLHMYISCVYEKHVQRDTFYATFFWFKLSIIFHVQSNFKSRNSKVPFTCTIYNLTATLLQPRYRLLYSIKRLESIQFKQKN